MRADKTLLLQALPAVLNTAGRNLHPAHSPGYVHSCAVANELLHALAHSNQRMISSLQTARARRLVRGQQASEPGDATCCASSWHILTLFATYMLVHDL